MMMMSKNLNIGFPSSSLNHRIRLGRSLRRKVDFLDFILDFLRILLSWFGKMKFYAYFRVWRNINADILVLLSDSICQTQPKHLQIVRWQYCLDSFWRWNILHISDFHAVYEVLQGAINGRKLWHFSRVIAKSKIYLSGSLNFEFSFWLAFHTLHVRGKVQNLTIWKCWPAFHTSWHCVYMHLKFASSHQLSSTS